LLAGQQQRVGVARRAAADLSDGRTFRRAEPDYPHLCERTCHDQQRFGSRYSCHIWWKPSSGHAGVMDGGSWCTYATPCGLSHLLPPDSSRYGRVNGGRPWRLLSYPLWRIDRTAAAAAPAPRCHLRATVGRCGHRTPARCRQRHWQVIGRVALDAIRPGGEDTMAGAICWSWVAGLLLRTGRVPMFAPLLRRLALRAAGVICAQSLLFPISAFWLLVAFASVAGELVAVRWRLCHRPLRASFLRYRARINHSSPPGRRPCWSLAVCLWVAGRG